MMWPLWVGLGAAAPAAAPHLGAAQRSEPHQKCGMRYQCFLGGRVGRAVCWVGAGVGGAWGELHPPSRLLGGVQARITRTFRGPTGPLWPQHTRFAACCCHSVVLPSVVAEQQEGAQGTCDNRRTLWSQLRLQHKDMPPRLPLLQDAGVRCRERQGGTVQPRPAYPSLAPPAPLAGWPGPWAAPPPLPFSPKPHPADRSGVHVGGCRPMGPSSTLVACRCDP